jgi:hypothetical protein
LSFYLIWFFVGLVKTDSIEVSPKQKDKRQFSLFSLVVFPNNDCTGRSSGDTGTCFTESECTNKGGSTDGNCAQGFGTCCIFSSSTCGTTATQNKTYVTNPSYPSTYSTSGSCTFTVTPVSSDICQMRLDFSNFDLTESTSTGACTDSFAITSSSSRTYPTLCGTLTGEHIYFETARATSSQTLTFTISSSTSGTSWKVKIAQIECGSTSKAPNDCYQYFTGISGRVKSFNYGSTNLQIQGLSYSACIRQEYGYCGILWGPTQGLTTDTFEVSSTATAQTGGAVANDENAFLGIPCSRDDLYSGGNFAYYNSIAQTSDSAILASGCRFSLQVYNLASTQTGATGFDLSYHQAPCSNAVIGDY